MLIDGIRLLNNLKMANSDGIDPDRCLNVRISNCHIERGDDAIVLKNSGDYKKYGPCENMVVADCTLVSTSAAIKFGTEGESDFRNILVENCCISRSNRGISIRIRDVMATWKMQSFPTSLWRPEGSLMNGGEERRLSA